MFSLVPEKNEFAGLEQEILEYWTKIKAFETSYEKSKGRPEYTFYDGPPFATGLPHYGHILAGTIKDIVTRYAHQTGHCVSRRFGWDCHGLPVEYEIDKKLGIKSKEDVAKLGVGRYNAECRAIVMRYASEWERVVKRMGRWIDFENDYKTLDPNFMESVWWVFKQLYEKGLVYQGFKVMPYSTGCNTPLSNFEAGQNYKDVKDPAVVVSFPIIGQEDTAFLAWTTTPWTLPSNLALCVNPTFEYVTIKDAKTGSKWVLAECRLSELYPDKKKAEGAYEVLKKQKGSELKGMKYVPLFEYFANRPTSFVVCCDGYVTDDSGTGIVHQAPAFGEDDYRVCMEHGVIKRGEPMVCPVNDNGYFTAEVTHFVGQYVKDADKEIMRFLRKNKRLIKDAQIEHSYPHCWRSDTPLLYRAVPSWFVNVPMIKEKLLANNLKSSWVPQFVQEKRFHNWLRDARDWAVSRSRYWGTPLPIWISDDKEEIVCVGSVQELKDLSGVKDITDLHPDSIAHITIPSKKGKGVLKRVDDVFDCWFESGSMPYAQVHYPFENKEKFEKGFPADFIAEGLDQTRGWFYTLMVISTALFDEPPFKNLIVNGLVLAADGKKMSKRLKNYPDPQLIVDRYGADALRIYLINSPVVRAEPLRFQEGGVRDVVKDIFIPWYNVYRLFVSESRRLEKATKKPFTPDGQIHKRTKNILDVWILSALQTLIKEVRAEMKAYHLYTVIPHLLKFIDQLSRWYVRFNKGRLKGSDGPEEAHLALQTLFKVLMSVCRLMGSFTPFLVEVMYQNLKKCLPEKEREDSVHYLLIPDVEEDQIDTTVERRVQNMQAVVELGRQAREKSGITFRTPIPSLQIISSDEELLADTKSLEEYVKNDINARSLSFSNHVSDFIKLKFEPERANLKTKVDGPNVPVLYNLLINLPHDKVAELQSKKEIEVEVGGKPVKIAVTDGLVTREFTGDSKTLEAQSSDNVLLIMSKVLDQSCLDEGIAREAMSRVQRLRKKAGLNVEDAIEAWYETDSKVGATLDQQSEFITAGLKVKLRAKSGKKTPDSNIIASEDSTINGVAISVFISKA